MKHFEKHSKGITALIDVTEAMLHAMEKHGVDPETVTNRPEFTVFVHFLKSIVDGELNGNCLHVYIVYEHKESSKNFLLM